MTEEQIQQAVDAARQARSEFFADDPAVGTAIFRMFAKYNVEVIYRQHGEAPREDGGKYILTLPKRTMPETDHYRMAHELGHIILGHSHEAMRLPVSTEISDEDRQANIFAANLLMPERKFRDVCSECRNNVYWVAYSFGVTPSAAGVRMAMLGIEEGKR